MPDAQTLLEHGDFLRALAKGLVRGDDLVEDVVQETWLAALARPPRPGPLRPWLATVAKNAARKLARGERRRSRREAAAARADETPATDELVARVTLLRSVVDAVTALDEPFRSAVLLRFFEGLPPREIARRLDVPVETARSRVRRGLERLRTALDEHGERRSWCLGLLALTGLPGALAMKSKLPLAVTALLLLVAVAGLWHATRGTGATAPARTQETRAVATVDGDADDTAVSPSTTPASATLTLTVLDEAGLPVADADAGGTRTGTDGVAEIADPPDRLVVDHAAFVPIVVEDAAAGGARRVRLLRGQPLEGRVLVAGTGEPAVGARLVLGYAGRFRPAHRHARPTAVVAADGTIRWPRVAPGVAWFEIESPGFLDWSEHPYVAIEPDAPPPPFTFYVARATLVRVALRDERGRPLHGARVAYDIEHVGVGTETVVGDVFQESVLAGGTLALEVHDAEGRRGSLRVVAEGAAMERVLVLERGAAHAGSGVLRVEAFDVVTGVPVTGAEATYAFTIFANPEARTRTDASGAAVWEGVPAGDVRVNVRAPGYLPATAAAKVTATERTTVRVGLEAGLSIRGRVLGGAGAAVGAGGAHTTCAADGSFVLDGLTPGNYALIAQAAHGRRLRVNGVPASTHGLELRFPPRGTLRIVARDAGDRPVRRVFVRLRHENGDEREERLYGDDGNYMVRHPEGAAVVRLFAPGWRPAEPRRVDVAADEVTRLDVVFARRAAELVVVVRDEDGGPVVAEFEVLRNGARVDVARDPYGGPFTTLHDGRVRVALPFEGPATVVLDRGPDGTPAGQQVVELRDGVPAKALFAVEPRLVLWDDHGPFRQGDVIERWNGAVVRRKADLPPHLAVPVEVHVRRDGRTETVTFGPGLAALPLEPHLTVR